MGGTLFTSTFKKLMDLLEVQSQSCMIEYVVPFDIHYIERVMTS